MKNYLKSILSLNLIKKIIYKNEYSPITPLNDNVEKRKVLDILGGDLNPDKVFYVIRRYPGTGLFSNLAYVMNHIQIANRMGFIPVVDVFFVYGRYQNGQDFRSIRVSYPFENKVELGFELISDDLMKSIQYSHCNGEVVGHCHVVPNKVVGVDWHDRFVLNLSYRF